MDSEVAVDVVGADHAKTEIAFGVDRESFEVIACACCENFPISLGRFDLGELTGLEFVDELAIDDVLHQVIVGDELNGHDLSWLDEVFFLIVAMVEKEVILVFPVFFLWVAPHASGSIRSFFATAASARVIPTHLIVGREGSREFRRIKEVFAVWRGGHPEVVYITWAHSFNRRVRDRADDVVGDRYSGLELLLEPDGRTSVGNQAVERSFGANLCFWKLFSLLYLDLPVIKVLEVVALDEFAYFEKIFSMSKHNWLSRLREREGENEAQNQDA